MFNNVTWTGGCAVNLTVLAVMTIAGGLYVIKRGMKLKDA